jgi:hypothetical protein
MKSAFQRRAARLPLKRMHARESGPNTCEPRSSSDIAVEEGEPLGSRRSQHALRKPQQTRGEHSSGVSGTARSRGPSVERGRPSAARVATAAGGPRGNPRPSGSSKESARLVVAVNAGNAAGAKGPCESRCVLKQERKGDCREASHAPSDSELAESALSAREAVA